MNIEQRIEGLAMDALKIVNNEPSSLTSAAIKVAQEHGLNPFEVEHLCARMNHIYFKNAFITDKLVQFNVATHKDVNGEVNSNPIREEKVAEFVIDCSTDLYEDVSAKKVAEESEDNAPDEGTDRLIANEHMKAMTQTGDEIEATDGEFDETKERMYTLIKAYVQDGMSLDDIYEALLKSWGDDNKEDVKAIFDQIKTDLVSDGTIKEGQVVTFKKLSEYSDREPSDDIKGLATEIADINYKMAKLVFTQIKLANQLSELGHYKYAENKLMSYVTRKNVYHFVSSNMDKTAGYPEEYHAYRGALSDLTNKQLKKRMSGSLLGGGFGSGWKDVLPAMAKKTVPLLAVSAIFFAADRIANSVKRNKVKNELPTKYPDLVGNISQKDYNDIFDAVVKKAPSLLDEPYSLANQISKYDAYGGIDTASLKDLAGMQEDTSKTKGKQLHRTALDTAIKSLAMLE